MTRGHDEQHLVLEERCELDIGMVDRPSDADVRLAAQHHVEDLLGVAGPYPKTHVRVRRPERMERSRQHVGAHRRRGRDDQGADRALPEVGEQLASLIDGRDRALGVGEERAPGVGQAHPAMGPHEELDP